MNEISVNIEHLVLDSPAVQPGNGQRFARMTEAALERFLEQQGLPPGLAGSDVLEMTAPNVNLPSNASNEQRAQELALALYRALYRMR